MSVCVSFFSFSSGLCTNVDIQVLYVLDAVIYACLLTVDFCGSNKGSLIRWIITICKYCWFQCQSFMAEWSYSSEREREREWERERERERERGERESDERERRERERERERREREREREIERERERGEREREMLSLSLSLSSLSLRARFDVHLLFLHYYFCRTFVHDY